MSAGIVMFLVAGVVFGLASYRWRHHFSEGTARPGSHEAGQGLDGRLAWLAVCTLLWPLLLVTGALGQMSRRSLARQRAQSAARRAPR